MKLTNEKRDAIIRKAMGVFRNRDEAQATEADAIAVLLYDSLYPTDLQTLMAKLPDTAFWQKSQIWVQTSDLHTKEEFTLKSSRKVFAIDNEWKCPCLHLDVEKMPALAARIAVYRQRTAELKQDKKLMNEKLKGLVYGLSTLAQLKKEWPEGATYYSHLENVKKAPNLPAVRGADVTALLLQMQEEL